MAAMWHVKTSVFTTHISETGAGFDSVYEVSYQVDQGPAAGTVGMVRIPASQYNADTVKRAIDAIVMHHDAIFKL